MNNLYFNNKSAFHDFDLVIVNAIEYPFVREKVEKISIEGNRNGYLTTKTGEYEDLSISVTFRLFRMDNYKNRMRDINFWLTDIEDDTLFFEDYREKCYKVKNCVINPIKDLHFNSADFNVVFELSPFIYKNDEFSETVENNSVVYNEGDLPSEPTIVIDVQGTNQNIDLVIGEQNVQFKGVEGRIILNNFKKLIYNDNKKSLSKKMIGNFISLQKGNNNVSWTGNIQKFTIYKNTIYKG